MCQHTPNTTEYQRKTSPKTPNPPNCHESGWKSNRAETTAIIPVVEAFQAAHGMRSSSLSPTPACSQPLTSVFNGS